ncbi:MAG TPA: hypothetical protein VGO47_02705, partial [Chlamydiales bacterium]|nr:hypothetical protein [Chlamydiales bacterium]
EKKRQVVSDVMENKDREVQEYRGLMAVTVEGACDYTVCGTSTPCQNSPLSHQYTLSGNSWSPLYWRNII